MKQKAQKCRGTNHFLYWALLSTREEMQPKSTSHPSSGVLRSSMRRLSQHQEKTWSLCPGSNGQPHESQYCLPPRAPNATSPSWLSCSCVLTEAWNELLSVLPITPHSNRLPFSATQDDKGWHLKTPVSFPVCHMIPLFLSLWNGGSNRIY